MTIIASQVDRFNRLGATWWNSAGPTRPLHGINALRLEYLRQLMARQFTRAAPSNLAGLRVLDIGCGAGLLCEPLAQCGAQVTGIDAAAKDVAAARTASAQAGKPEETDPQAVALAYRHDATKVGAKKFPAHAPGHNCADCQLFQGKPGDAFGACGAMGGKLVNAKGWCVAWVKKA